MLLLSGAANAMGDSSATTPTCPKGQIYDSRTKSCMVDKGGMLSDADRARYAYSLAKAGRYDEALGVLNTLRQPNTAQAWNYRGYATRKLGRTDEGIGYYQKSIALDPHYAQVREYLGEAYMIKGRPDLAREQLATIKTLCGTGCEEYRDLAAAIDGHPEL
ncbi:tetratricopeptide repeat protein [Sodalis sp. C49]|uniref:tetratricopeptide repeat protein n=1 Tax=unclassified Sodalis (in: enterobacteria) TaxID=2636512 RepID=UPI003965A050